MPEWTHQRARIAALTRSRTADDPDLIDAKQKLRSMMLAEHIKRVVDGAPPLTDAQRHALARMLQGGVSA